MLKRLGLNGLVTLMVGLGLLAACGDNTAAPTSAPATTAAAGTTAAQTTGAATTSAASTTAVPTTSSAATTAATTTGAAASSAATTTSAATTPAATTGATTSAVTTAAETTEAAAATAGPGEFQNPVLVNDFADPAVWQFNGKFYAYATNANGKNIQVATSTDILNWTLGTDAMPALPTWAKLGGSLVWAPDVTQIGSKFVMYFTARDKASDRQCVGVATADAPEGKFKDTSSKPLVCQADDGGTIDPSVFKDNGKLYLYFKNDGNCCSIPTSLYAQELAADGLSLTGQPTKLMSNDASWEGLVVEAPQMFKHDNSYYLFFSANDYAGANYAVGYAACKSATGPCEQAAENPVLKSLLKKPPVIGPGGQSLIQVGDQTWIFYHAWEVSEAGLKTDRRLMWLDKVNWQNGKPVIQGPTTGPQPTPKI